MPATVIEKDSSAALSIASPTHPTKFTKYIALRFHHYCIHVSAQTILLQYVCTDIQIADALTKIADQSSLHRLVTAFDQNNARKEVEY